MVRQAAQLAAICLGLGAALAFAGCGEEATTPAADVLLAGAAAVDLTPAG